MQRSPDIRLSRFATRTHASRSGRAWVAWLAAPGVVALVVEPAVWLGRSWLDPAYDSDGMVAAGVVAALLVASVASGGALPDPRDRRRAWIALGLTAAVRLAGRVLAVNTVGALALVVDVWALAVLLGVRRRPFALRPVGLALLFVLALPVEHLAQRLLGHPLQLASAAAAEWALWPFFPDVAREGVLLVHPGVALAVDLPCSGARGLVLLSGLGLGLFACRAPGFVGTCAGAGAVVAGAFAANALRIVALFVGQAIGVPLVDEPWHSLLGATVLGLAATPLLALGLRAPAREPVRAPLGHRAAAPWIGSRRGWPGARGGAAVPPWMAAALVSVVGVAVAHTPARPLDVSAPIAPRPLPATLGRFVGVDVPLEPQEARYYTQWGGSAQKRIYDDGAGVAMTALLVRTRSPLRHLHAPDTCLRGAGHRVTRLGVVPGATPSVLYRSEAPDGRVWRVEASFVSDRGDVATSVSEVVWRWTSRPDATWSLVERITAWPVCEVAPARCRDFEAALLASLDLPLDDTRWEKTR